MPWSKGGLVFAPGEGWMRSHAQVPTPLAGDGYVRVYFASRPDPRVSMTTFVDLDRDDPRRVLRLHPDPILELGAPGAFDEHGIMPSCAVRDGDTVYLYYSGWSRGTTVPYVNTTGLAVSTDGGETFEKVGDGPVVGLSAVDPLSATSPGVVRERGDWYMWYCSGTEWLEVDSRQAQTYDIKLARSTDGIQWEPTGDVAIAQRTPYEAITRSYVVRGADTWHMWFCYRGSHDFRDGTDAYRIGYASSRDLATWIRDDTLAGIDVSPGGWDSRMLAYPAVLPGDPSLLFYNGNGFGAGGFGYATWVD